MAINAEAFYDMINNISRKQVESTAMDLTIDACIVKLVLGDTGEYQVRYQGNTFSAFTTDPTVTYQQDENVYVLVPAGDFSRKKIILGRSEYKNISEGDRQALEQIWVPEGPNWVGGGENAYKIDHEPLQICAVPYASRNELIHEKEDGTIGANWEDVGFQRYSRREEAVNVDIAETVRLLKEELQENFEAVFGKINEEDYEKDETYRNAINQKLLNMEMQPGGDVVATTRYPSSYPSGTTDLVYVDNLFQNYSKVYDHIMIGGIFRTQFCSPHEIGNYALRATFIANNPEYVKEGSENYENIGAQPKYIFLSFDLGFKNFNGNPYAMPIGTPQKAYFEVTPGTLQGLYRLSLYQDGNFMTDIIPTYNDENQLVLKPENAVLDENNIFVEDIDIRFCRKINLNDGLYHCWIETPNGNSLYNGSDGYEGIGTVDLIPHLYYQGQEVTADAKIMWFRQDLSVSVGTPAAADKDEYNNTWVDYLDEPWWRPIEQFIENPEDAETAQKLYDISSSGVLTITKAAVPWMWTYRLVCTHEGKALAFDDCEVKNLDSQYDLYIEKLTDDKSTQSLLRINDWQVKEDGSRVGKVGKVQVPQDKWPSTEFKFYPEWFGDWYVQTSGNALEPISKMLRGPRNINAWAKADAITFWAAAYDPFQILPGNPWEETYEGLTQRAPIGYVKFSELRTEDLEMLIEWVGDTSFNYTTQGYAYPGVNGVEKRVQPKIHWLLGEQHQHPFVYLKTGQSRVMLSGRNYLNPSEDVTAFDSDLNIEEIAGFGWNPDNSMMEHIWVDKENVIHFHAKSRYDDTATDNTFVAVVHLIAQGQFFESECEISFNFDGQQGTQGTEWRAEIQPTNCKEHTERTQTSNSLELLSSATLPYTAQLGLDAYPITIVPTMGGYKQAENSLRVCIRPFCFKGKDLLNSAKFGEAKHYRIRARYDARYPQGCRDAKYRYMSFLRFHHCDDNAHQMYRNSEVNGIDTFNLTPANEDGMLAETWWYGDESGRPENSNYNAVEVRFKDPSIADVSLREAMDRMRHNFVVKCQIDVYTDKDMEYLCYDASSGVIKKKNTNNAWHLVKNFVVWYPIDIFIAANEQEPRFNPRYCSINWPREIIYSSTGSDPINWQRPLEMWYGHESVTDRKEVGQFIIPESETINIHHVDVNEKTGTGTGSNSQYDAVDENGNLVIGGNLDAQAALAETPSLAKDDGNRYTLVAKEGLSWQDGMIGTLYGEMIGKISNEPGVPSIPRGVFYRNQVFILNSYGNVDINGWDGMGIDIDEDNGTIFAPTIGAGFKNPYNNKFTGVLMGVNKEHMRIGRTAGLQNVYSQCTSGAADVLGGNKEMSGEYVEDIFVYPYMTGLFGYQEGVASFGLLENGTAFFGRADRGARIIIDGNNGTIYGGINGELTDPKIGDPMWNGMRLTLADLSGDGGGPAVGNMLIGYSNQFYGNPDINGQGIGGKDPYQTLQTLPEWYKWIWQGSYFNGKGQTPYWLKSTGRGSYDSGRDRYEDLIKDGNLIPRIQAGYTRNYGGETYEELTNRGENVFFNYWDPDREGLQMYLSTLFAALRDEISAKEENLAKVKEMLKRDEVRQEEVDKAQKELDNANKYLTDLENNGMHGFGPSRASTTPAIEIGQHPPGLMPGLLPWDSVEKVFQNLFIPGDRNFMVTYDGTLWAMNGVFLGNVIGSNIIGGRIQGAEIGLGPSRRGKYDIFIPDPISGDDWANLRPPKLMHDTISENAPAQFYADSAGNLYAHRISITGGGIDLGSFHIESTYKRNDDGSYSDVKNANGGHLIQMGHSDFIGPTHFYGSVGIGMNLEKNNMGNEGAGYPYVVGGTTGNLFQTNGLVALGIPLPSKAVYFHRLFAGSSNTGYDMDIVSSLNYNAGTIKPGDPGIEDRTKTTVEQSAFFAVKTNGEGSVRDGSRDYKGHFWPLAFRYKISEGFESPGGTQDVTDAKGVHAYFQLMDIFKSKTFQVQVSGGNKGGDAAIEGGNYFRVGPWGPEWDRSYICEGWQPEEESKWPTPKRQNATAKGYVGLVSRQAPDPSSPKAIGMTSWDETPIIFWSDGNGAFRTQDALYLEAWSELKATEKDEVYKSRKQPVKKRTSMIRLAKDINISVANQDARDNSENGVISLGVLKKGGKGNNVANTSPIPGDADWSCGLYLAGEVGKQGTWLYQQGEYEMHIVCGDLSNHPNHAQATADTTLGYSELWLKKGQIRLAADDAWSLCLGNNAHGPYYGSYRIGMDKTSTMYCHPNSISIWANAQPGENWSTAKPGVHFTKDSVYFGDGKGWIRATGGHIYFEGEWAQAENQHNIHARFA